MRKKNSRWGPPTTVPFYSTQNLEYLDNLAIEYLTNKLIEEYKKECQK